MFPYVGAFADGLRKALRSQRPDVLHTHGWLAGLAGLLANRQGGPPLVHTLVNRSWPPRQRPGRPGQTVQLDQLRMRRAITRRATRVIVDGPSDQLGLIQLGISRRRISVPGVDCDKLNPDGTREPRQEPFRLLLLGAPEPIGKGPGAAIEALAGLPDTELVIVPDPHDQSWPARFGWARELAAPRGRQSCSPRSSARTGTARRAAALRRRRALPVRIAAPGHPIAGGNGLCRAGHHYRQCRSDRRGRRPRHQA